MGGLECSRLQGMFWNVLGKGWVAWNEKLGTDSHGKWGGADGLSRDQCELGWDGQAGSDSWVRALALALGCGRQQKQWEKDAHPTMGAVPQ